MSRHARPDGQAGRHAHPVDQAEAVLWADLQSRALMLSQHYESMSDPEGPAYLTSMGAVAGWMDAARRVLQEVATCR